MSMTDYAYETPYSCTNETVSGVRIPQLFETSHLLIVEELNSIKCSAPIDFLKIPAQR
jgi:hypothetical protein